MKSLRRGKPQTSALRAVIRVPRISIRVYSSDVYGSIIDPSTQRVMVHVSSKDPDVMSRLQMSSGALDPATAVGEEIARRALAKDIRVVVFEGRGLLQLARIKRAADAAARVGLKF